MSSRGRVYAASLREGGVARSVTEGECGSRDFRSCNAEAFFSYAGSPCHNVALRLAAARSRSGSDTPPACHSLPSRRFATSRRGATVPPQAGRYASVKKQKGDTRGGYLLLFHVFTFSFLSCFWPYCRGAGGVRPCGGARHSFSESYAAGAYGDTAFPGS